MYVQWQLKSRMTFQDCTEIQVKTGKVSEMGCESGISALKIVRCDLKIQSS